MAASAAIGSPSSRWTTATARRARSSRCAGWSKRTGCFFFNTLGTPPNTAIEKYLNQKKIPQLFVATGADKWNYQEFPWTIGWQPSYRIEARIYAKYISQTKPDAKIAVLYQNDDFGRDYLTGVKDVLGDKYDNMVKAVSYETSDPTVEPQVVALQASGANALIIAATPKFAAQAIRKVFDVEWNPTDFLTNVSISVNSVMTPAGPEKGVASSPRATARTPPIRNGRTPTNLRIGSPGSRNMIPRAMSPTATTYPVTAFARRWSPC